MSHVYIFSLFPGHLVLNVNYCCNRHGEEPSTSTDGLVAHPPAATATATATDEEGTLSVLETHAPTPRKRLVSSDSETLLPNSSSIKRMNLADDGSVELLCPTPPEEKKKPSFKKENDTPEAPEKESNHTLMNPPPSSAPKQHPPPFIKIKRAISKITRHLLHTIMMTILVKKIKINTMFLV